MTLHRYGLISDTHGSLHPAVFEAFKGIEAILHAGDVCSDFILSDLETIAPTHGVLGNCDQPAPSLPPLRVLDFPFGRCVLTHSHLIEPLGGGAARLARHFRTQAPRLIVFGHTHKPLREEVDGVWLVNPGPAGKPRFRDSPQIVVMTWDSERDTLTFEDVPLDWSSLSR
ncbi:MAG: metallophosphoesterase family protein [Sumerlaeia bacterium]